ncbi:chaperonin complex component, TCP-1 gamma subunit, putative [Ixodes scapularis]|uniref:T-complex protein 1 subunit gamma n=1 Tax=Ixodes scapularis TaxID=6945 RepID=B7P3Z6_IXOSC|nr:chaperonin complex component, TCP-1 gamma subunit, putative [Ixodes scapularis]|eukprot:XP_002404954.1 chaperonin complex component, TCP-1 gamma subunit, putative [Ixodes scapularis]
MMGRGQVPILVLSQNTKRESGRKVQIENVRAAKAVADVIRTCLGPRAMLKMLMNPIGGIIMTNDGNAILREITVQHPAAKSMIEISRTQDEEVGDGTTSVIILAGELLSAALPFLEQNMHPTVIIAAYRQALEDIVTLLKDKIRDIYGRATVRADAGNGSSSKIPGGSIEESCVLRGVMLNKDVTHPKMKRRIEKPRIVLLDCNLVYKKGESQTNIEILREEDFSKILEIEEQYIQQICADIIKLRPDVVITEKGVSDLAQHYLMKANISVVRRVRKSDNNRIARVCGATIANRTDELKEEDVGTKAGLFEIKKIGEEYFCFLTECEEPKACTILLRGASKDVLQEVERNLQDAMAVARNVMLEPRLVPGGGAVEMALGHHLTEKGKSITGVQQWPYRAVAKAFEIIPATLVQNCGANTIRALTALRAKHASGDDVNWSIDGETGNIVPTSELQVWEPLVVKLQAYKTALETAILLLRIDDIVSGSKKKDKGDGDQGGPAPAPTEESMKE